MKKKSPTKIFIIAGEMSGDILGAKLMRSLKSKERNIVFKGVGGPKMHEEGIRSLFSIQKIALWGFLEILPHIFRVKHLINKTIEEVYRFNPDIIVTIDSPGFNFRVIKGLQGLNCKKIHYVAPSVWIKPKRVKFLEKFYDKVLTILPFEKKYFDKSLIQCDFVGHPILEEDFENSDGRCFCKKHKISDEQILLVVMTGSRESEYRKLTPIFLDAINLMAQKNQKKVVAAFPYVSNAHRKFLSENVRDSDMVKILFVPEAEKKALYSSADIALVKSGTSSLEIAIAKLPIVVAYKVSFVTAWILRNILKFRGFVSIINLLANKMIIPELLQEDCDADKISSELSILLEKKNADEQVKKSLGEIKKLQPKDGQKPSMVAALAVLGTLHLNKNL